MKKLMTVLMMAAFALPLASCEDDAQSQENMAFQTKALELAQDEGQMLLKMVEEEKMAGDLYQALGGLWRARVFANIEQAERRHQEQVRALLAAAGLEDPTADAAAGVFQDAEIQALYDELWAKGQLSYLDALVVGATVEDADLYDLGVFMAELEPGTISETFACLALGSRNHMRAFSRNLERMDMTYVPQFISSETYEAILAQPHETGIAAGCPCEGQGTGNGRGGNGNGQGSGDCDGTGNGGNGNGGGNCRG